MRLLIKKKGFARWPLFSWVLLILLFTSSGFAQDWNAVQKIIGQEGDVEQGVMGFSFPRSDVHLVVHGRPVSSDFATAWIGFWTLPDGRVQLMGDIAMPANNVSRAQKELLQQGLQITALHNHLLGEVPRMMFMHIQGFGNDAVSLAKKVRPVLNAANVPLSGEEKEAGENEKTDWSSVTSILGKPAEEEGNILEYTYVRPDLVTLNGVKLPFTEGLETKSEVTFQMMDDGDAVTAGEVWIRASEIDSIATELEKHGITITALHNHMLNTEPRMFWMHLWGSGDPGELAKGSLAALKKIHLSQDSLPN